MSVVMQAPLIARLAIALFVYIPMSSYAQGGESPDGIMSTTAETVAAKNIATANVNAAISIPPASKRFEWQGAASDSVKFLLLQTVARVSLQDKTRDGLAGHFGKDYLRTLKQSPKRFLDGDSWFTNFVGHPVQGATSYHIARFRGATRTQAFWWGVAYSMNFELGPLGEAGIGNVRLSPVDLVVTPSAGFVLGATEEWLFTKLSGFNNNVAKAVRFGLAGRRLSRLVAGSRK